MSLSYGNTGFLHKVTSSIIAPSNVPVKKINHKMSLVISACENADRCDEISTAQTLKTALTDVNCSNFTVTSLQGCFDNANPEDSLVTCGFHENPTVWFKIETDLQAKQLHTFVSTTGSWQPVWAIFSGDCTNLTQVIGGTVDAPANCSNDDFNPNTHAIWLPEGPDGNVITTYYIAVTSQGTVDTMDFTLSAFTQSDCVSCIGQDNCETEAEFTIISRSGPRALDDLTFCQGEEVSFCFKFYYDPSETGVDWFHSIIPDFGDGWDMDSFDPNSVTTAPEGAQWFGPEDGDCAPYVTESMPLLCSYTDEHGQIKICNIKCGACPCSPPLDSATILPGGWYWISPGGQGCDNTCNPSTSYGFPGSNVGLQVEVCLTLKTKILTSADCSNNNDLQISFTPTSDGVTGCWEDPVAECRLDVTQYGPKWKLECAMLTDNDLVFKNDTIYDGDFLNLEITSIDSNRTLVIKPVANEFISGMNAYTFENGRGVITDQLINLIGDNVFAKYLIYSYLPGQECSSKADTLMVLVKPIDCAYYQYRLLWPNCADASNHTVICNLNDLEPICGEMFIEADSAGGPTPLCPDGGLSNNMTWLAFIAGNGDYEIVIRPSSCNVGSGGQLGIQAGVYTDCSFSESVFCQPECSTGNVIIPDSVLIPGHTYYLFLDGCAFSYCDFDIDVTGSYSPYNIPCNDGNPETVNDVLDENCVCKGTAISCDTMLSYRHWESCKMASENKVLCNLSILDKMCGDMLTTISADPKPDPLCPLEGGVAHNMSWIAFVAEEGSYEIVVTPSNCIPGTGGQIGAQIGVYTDCSFSETVICNAPCDTNSVTIPDSLLTPGKTYYLFIDGCAQSVCDYKIDVIGTYSSKDVPCDDGNPQTINDRYDENCECVGELINATDQENQDIIQIFPNPTNENVYVLHTGKQSNFDISILNTVGETIFIQKSKVDKGYELHTANLTPGIYLIYIRTENVNRSYKLVKY